MQTSTALTGRKFRSFATMLATKSGADRSFGPSSNAILTPQAFKRFRVPLHTASIIEIAGPLQNVDDVVHVRVRELTPLAARETLPASHDYR